MPWTTKAYIENCISRIISEDEPLGIEKFFFNTLRVNLLFRDNQLKLLKRIDVLKEFPENNTRLILTSHHYTINTSNMHSIPQCTHVWKFQNIVLEDHQLNFEHDPIRGDGFVHTLVFTHAGYGYELEQ